MARDFGDVLRGLGSALNPQVAASVEAQRREEEQSNRAVQLGMLNHVIQGVQSGAVDPSVLQQLNPQLAQMFQPSPEAQARAVALRRQAAREKFFQTPAVQEALSSEDPRKVNAVLRSYMGQGLADNPLQAMEEFRKLSTVGQRVVGPGASVVDENGRIITTVPDKTKPVKTEWIGVPGGKKVQAVIDQDGNVVRTLGDPIDAHSPAVNVYNGGLVAGKDPVTGRSVFVQPSGRADVAPRVVSNVVPPDSAASIKANDAANSWGSINKQIDDLIGLVSSSEGRFTGATGLKGYAGRATETVTGMVNPDVATPALDTKNKKELLVASLRKVMADSNMSRKDKEALETALGGIESVEATKGSTIRGLNNLREFVRAKFTQGRNQQQEGFEVGKVYVDGKGNRARFLGAGKWEEQ